MRGLLLVVGVLVALPARGEATLVSRNPVVPLFVEGLLAADMLQTLDAQSRWDAVPLSQRAGLSGHETNPILGPHPSAGAIVGYFAVVGMGYGVAYKKLPEEWGFLLSCVVIAVEAPTIAHNHELGFRIHL